MVAKPTGSPDTILVCIRGKPGSGKSSIRDDICRARAFLVCGPTDCRDGAAFVVTRRGSYAGTPAGWCR